MNDERTNFAKESMLQLGIGAGEDTKRLLLEYRQKSAAVAAVFRVYEIGGFDNWTHMVEALAVILCKENEKLHELHELHADMINRSMDNPPFFRKEGKS